MSELLLDQLARLRGLGEAYYDHRGELRYFSAKSRRAILQAMNLPVDDEAALRAAIDQEAARSKTYLSNEEALTTSCYRPPWFNERKCWGISVQLYTLRSARNWGGGDFADLRELIELAAPLGCDLIGLNPLHALFPAEPRHCSPYSPSSRLFLNVLYIAIDAIPEFASCAAVQELYSQPAFQSALIGLRATDRVMYEQVAAVKFCALRLLHHDFCESQLAANSTRAHSFRDFIIKGDESLRLHAVFDVLDRHFREQGLRGWRHWPVEYRDPRSNAVHEFAARHAGQVEFFMYLQWLANEQLAAAQQFAREKGMRIGLYGDLAVGANPDGSEVWSNQALYVQGSGVGAPPDPLALNGQDWGIPPIDPYALRAQAYRPFVELLHFNMQHIGALRIDHVMSLFRLWWVPRGSSAVDGVYVHYPLDELVKLLAKESQRSQCLVIGEDLGTVPDEMRHAMTQYFLCHYQVLLFEKYDDGQFKLPDAYVRNAIAAATTHDLPPLKAWWQGDDLALRESLGVYPSAEIAQYLRHERQANRRALLQALGKQGLWYWYPNDALPTFSLALARAIHLYLGSTQAALVLVQLEDLIGMTDPVNVPGTHNEHANWQRKLVTATTDIFANAEVRETLHALTAARAG